ncbi:hypothetical protein PFISCL1PPCAC_25333, partial [Pristionchus fissidentatus]
YSMRISNNRNEPITHAWVDSVGEVCPEQINMPVCKFKQSQITKIETTLRDLYLPSSFKNRILMIEMWLSAVDVELKEEFTLTSFIYLGWLPSGKDYY